ncbi:hypothetical protein AB0M64_17805 [Streptomyces sp. NPDC051771]|uniref:hypothetical protein n=1 Tax=Streptomyces sp. NPDC051771 TaxID=3154847 RepID=UPI00342AAB31
MAGRNLAPLPTYRKDAVTRKLCAHVYLDDAFAHDMDVELTGDRLTAIGLPLGVNLVALARHARVAARRVRARDRTLSLLFLLLWAGVALLPLGLAVDPFLGGAGAAIGLAALVGGWWATHHDLAVSWREAQRVFQEDTRPEEQAPAVESDAEDRLRALARANVLPYTASAGHHDPFVGHGEKVKDVVWHPIDVSQPADDPANPGRKLTARSFDAVDLHTFVAREMETISGLEGLRARNRLYVSGDHVPYLVGELLDSRVGRPRPQISPDLVRTGLIKPGAGTRTYLSLERISDGGRVVVSVHMRARLHPPSLSWEFMIFVIPPPAARFYTVTTLPTQGFDRFRMLFGGTNSIWWRCLTGSWSRTARRASLRRGRERALRRDRRDITRRNTLHDHGATDSVRERVSDPEQMLFSDSADAQDYLQRLQGGILIATERFLKDHHIDSASFDSTKQIINSNPTYNFNGIVQGNAFGHQNVVQNTPGQPGAGGGQPGPGGQWAQGKGTP